MSHRKLVVVVLMALVMVFVSAPGGIAGGPNSTDWSDVDTDGGDGHPWDDGTSGQDTSPPDGDPNVETEQSPAPEPEFVLTASASWFPSWHTSAVFYLWKSIKAEVTQTRVSRSFKKVRLVR